MNDRFKFRVWDKENNKMFTPPRHFNYCCVNGTIVCIESYCQIDGFYKKRIIKEFDDAILMQCTGLKDKNGKLIYEGDIVKFKTELFGKPKQIIWDECYYILKDTYIIICNTEIKQFGLEVIGNIYENKELLESEG